MHVSYITRRKERPTWLMNGRNSELAGANSTHTNNDDSYTSGVTFNYTMRPSSTSCLPIASRSHVQLLRHLSSAIKGSHNSSSHYLSEVKPNPPNAASRSAKSSPASFNQLIPLPLPKPLISPFRRTFSSETNRHTICIFDRCPFLDIVSARSTAS